MSTQTHRGETGAERRKRSKEAYEAVVRAVDYNSGHMQPPLASQPSVIGTLHRAGYGLEEIHRAIVAALSNGDLFRARDDEGRVRLGVNDRWRLREKIETNLSRCESPRRDVIGIANQRVQKLRGDRDE